MKCCICNKEIFGPNANNPAPYADNGVCCDACNLKYVVPARIARLRRELGGKPETSKA